jgi:hypothetical protein
LGEVSVLSQILNIELSSFIVLERKKERRYTFVHRSQQRSTDLCTDFYIYPTYVCFCGGYEL